MSALSETVRQCYAAYETDDRPLLEGLLADDFTFTSPLDDRISRKAYFERCWPNHEHAKAFEIEKLVEDGGQVFATYTCERPDGTRFRNTEVFTFQGEKVQHVDVFFGPELDAIPDEPALRQAVAAWAEAIRQKDVEGVLRHFAEDSVRFYLAPPLQATMPLRENLVEWFETWKGEIGYEIRDLAVEMGDRVAFSHSLNRMVGKHVDGAETDLWFRETMGWRKSEGRWLIAHAHESVPFRMDGSGVAELGLRP